MTILSGINDKISTYWLLLILSINSDLTVTRSRTVAYGKCNLTYLGPVIWSKLDKAIRSSESLDTFKGANQLNWLISQA